MRSRLTVGMGLAVTLLVALGAAGCGGGKSKSTALTKAEFLAKGNAICRQGNAKINAEGQKEFRNRQPSGAAAKKFAVQVAIPTIQGEIDGVRALPAPHGDQATVKRITDTAQKDLDKVKANPTSLLGKGDPFSDANKLANAYGLTACGSGGG